MGSTFGADKDMAGVPRPRVNSGLGCSRSSLGRGLPLVQIIGLPAVEKVNRDRVWACRVGARLRRGRGARVELAGAIIHERAHMLIPPIERKNSLAAELDVLVVGIVLFEPHQSSYDAPPPYLVGTGKFF